MDAAGVGPREPWFGDPETGLLLSKRVNVYVPDLFRRDNFTFGKSGRVYFIEVDKGTKALGFDLLRHELLLSVLRIHNLLTSSLCSFKFPFSYSILCATTIRLPPHAIRHIS
jgi:hypothetical protein